jgi:hypothetical protein
MQANTGIYGWLAQQIRVVTDGVESEILKVVGHESGCTVEERLQLVLFLVAGNLLALVSLVENSLHFWEPPAHNSIING